MGQQGKSYFPIAVLETYQNLEDFEKKQKLFLDLICEKVPEGYKNPVKYSFSELTTNVVEHSKSEKEYLFAQYYPKKKFMDICILDTGRGIAQTYKEENKWELSDKDAITKAVEGYSTTKNLEGERGCGLRHSIKIVCEGLEGEFILVSGSAILYSEKAEKKLFSVSNFYWQGVVVLFRIPTREAKQFNLYDFIK
ncbi:MAG: hypothetical protein N3F63_06550 [Thermoplasmata archaeon]|nr:hypothetical protein [Thermoplasmata archaeon]